MFCQQCGTRVTTSTQRFCQECGGIIAPAQGPSSDQQGGNGAPRLQLSTQVWHVTPSLPPMTTRVIVHNTALRTLLMAIGLCLLLPLAIPLFFGSLIAGFALLGLFIHLAPLFAMAIVVYWFLTRQRHTLRH